VTRADWPARMQRLRQARWSRLRAQGASFGWTAATTRQGAGCGRNPGPDARREPTHLICGMLNTKDVTGYMTPLAPQVTRLHAVSIPGEKNTLPAEVTCDAARAAGIDAVSAPSVAMALATIAAKSPEARVLICGSLYLAGSVLRENG
jgi:dihydrofolate synthase/folylpolyglutamate synthase